MPGQVDAWLESLTGSNPLNFIQHVILTPTHSCWKLKHHKKSRLFGSVNEKLLHAFRARLFFLTFFAVRVLERRTLLDGLTKNIHIYTGWIAGWFNDLKVKFWKHEPFPTTMSWGDVGWDVHQKAWWVQLLYRQTWTFNFDLFIT